MGFQGRAAQEANSGRSKASMPSPHAPFNACFARNARGEAFSAVLRFTLTNRKRVPFTRRGNLPPTKAPIRAISPQTTSFGSGYPPVG